MQVAPAGDNAVLIDLGDVSAEELHAAARSISAMSAVTACIVGHSSLYAIVEPSSLPAQDELMAALKLATTGPDHSTTRKTRTIRVSFAGAPDLAELLEGRQLTLDAFLARVTTLRLTARYLGFRGGFAYLDGWPAEWAMPRRPTSRPVPRGSFAIAGDIAGFYPIDSPGGWNLLGRTEEDLEYALMPGDAITIAPSLAGISTPDKRRPRVAVPIMPKHIEILSAPLASIIHESDYSLLARGMPAGGPFDEIAAALAQRAVQQCQALLECAMTGPRLRFREDVVAAWCGPDLSVQVYRPRAGQELSIGRILGGLRGYLAIGRGEGVIAHIERGDRHVIRALRGPHDAGLMEVECEVTPRLDRVGIRLRPLVPLNVEIPADLRSCGMQFGTIQLHPDGSMVAMGPDHPVTGGYLQPMTVITSERWKLGQLMPGETVTLRAT
jgi:allophanate hydrolase subunit 1